MVTMLPSAKNLTLTRFRFPVTGSVLRVLNALLADVFVFTDHMSGNQAGASPGYGVTLVGETTTGCLISAEFSIDAGGNAASSVLSRQHVVMSCGSAFMESSAACFYRGRGSADMAHGLKTNAVYAF
jgi:hypothetical protein